MTIPAGLNDNGLEIYVFEGKPYAIYQGQSIPFFDLSRQVIDKFRMDMISNSKAFEALFQAGYTDDLVMIEKYVMCRYGGFDTRADLLASGKLIPDQYHDCGKRGQCEMEGHVCSNLFRITSRELQIIKHVAACKINKEIALVLSISEDTVKNHIRNIIAKIAPGGRKPDITAFAYKYKLI